MKTIPKETREMLHRSLDAFLDLGRSESEGGYAPVEKAPWAALQRLLGDLIRAGWEPDPDGDRPVDWMLIDRTRFEYMGYLPIPRKGKAPWHERLRKAVLNLRMATEVVDQMERVREYEDVTVKAKGE